MAQVILAQAISARGEATIVAGTHIRVLARETTKTAAEVWSCLTRLAYMCPESYECSLPLLNLTRAVKPDGKNSFPDLPTSEKLLAEELGQKVEEMCTLKRDIDVLQLQVNAKRRRISFLQGQCIAASGSLAKV